MIPFPLQILLFGCVGMAMEVVFTAIVELPRTRSARLQGFSYIWMFPIYAMTPILLRVLLPALGSWPLAGRLAVYVVLLYIIEYTTGMALRLATGACPWEAEYRGHRWAVHDLIRLDYAPAWAAACFMFERLYFLLNGIAA